MYLAAKRNWRISRWLCHWLGTFMNFLICTILIRTHRLLSLTWHLSNVAGTRSWLPYLAFSLQAQKQWKLTLLPKRISVYGDMQSPDNLETSSVILGTRKGCKLIREPSKIEFPRREKIWLIHTALFTVRLSPVPRLTRDLILFLWWGYNSELMLQEDGITVCEILEAVWNIISPHMISVED